MSRSRLVESMFNLMLEAQTAMIDLTDFEKEARAFAATVETWEDDRDRLVSDIMNALDEIGRNEGDAALEEILQGPNSMSVERFAREYDLLR